MIILGFALIMPMLHSSNRCRFVVGEDESLKMSGVGLHKLRVPHGTSYYYVWYHVPTYDCLDVALWVVVVYYGLWRLLRCE